ncbi:MAG TPA: cytochrome c oxidase subunit 3 family protein [Rhodocyclaceae bacterium]
MNTAVQTLPVPAAEARPHPPGDLAIWVFILAELGAFGLLFITYGFARMSHAALFDQMQQTLNRDAGALNTVLLVTASWCVARAVASIRNNASAASARWLLAGMLCGGGFLAVKMFEYAEKFSQGVNLDTNLFYMFYLILTFFHFMHVILGMGILGYVWLKTRRGGYSAADHNGMETGASYWHMVDLVWIVLFPLVYVMR